MRLFQLLQPILKLSNHQALHDTRRVVSFTPWHPKKTAQMLSKGASKQVSNFDLSNSNGKRSTATIYLGNVDYNASEQDTYKAVAPTFKQARVDKVIIPRVHGRSMYGFIARSINIWFHRDIMA